MLSPFEGLRILRLDFYNSTRRRGPVDQVMGDIDSLAIVDRHFWIPTLRSLHRGSVWLNRDQRSHLFPEERYWTSPITDLSMMLCHDQALDILPDILRSVQVLKRFTLEDKAVLPVDPIMIDDIPSWFARALRPHQSTLVDLVIARTEEATYLGKPLFGSLGAYISLKRLGIPESFLVQRHSPALLEWLPASLEVLQLQFQLRGDMELLEEEEPHQFERIKHLAAIKLARLPALRCVTWWVQIPSRGADLPVTGDEENLFWLGPLKDKFKDVGVESKLWYSIFFAATPMGLESGYSGNSWIDIDNRKRERAVSKLP